jgi:hypothetical protein
MDSIMVGDSLFIFLDCAHHCLFSGYGYDVYPERSKHLAIGFFGEIKHSTFTLTLPLPKIWLKYNKADNISRYVSERHSAII